MIRSDEPDRAEADCWDRYWRGAGDRSAFGNDSGGHPAIGAFWQSFFGRVDDDHAAPFCIDLASGGGAVLEAAERRYNGELPRFLCVDLSRHALAAVQQRFPGTEVLLADAGSVPLDDSCCEVVTSQFGIEYAGRRAISEMSRLVKRGGHFGAVLHHRGGVVFEASTRNLEATRRLVASRFLPLARRVFEAGFATAAGGARPAYETAAADLSPAVDEMEAVLSELGADVADGLLARLYNDIATLHENLASYRPDDVFRWLDGMQAEVDAYRERTQAMLEAAIDADDFNRIVAVLKAQGCDLEIAAPLMDPERDLPLAWSVHAIAGG